MLLALSGLQAQPAESIQKKAEVAAKKGPEPASQQLAAAPVKAELFRPVWESAVKYHADDVIEGVVFDLDPQKVAEFLQRKPQQFSLELPTGRGNETMTLEMSYFNIFAPGFQVFTSDNRNEPFDYQGGLHYRGFVDGEPGSLAAISIFEGEVMGLVSTREGSFTLGKVGKESLSHIFYNEKYLTKQPDWDCATEDDGLGYRPEQLFHSQRNAGDCVKIYIEVDRSITQAQGSVANATNFITGAFNQSFVIYANESINMAISEIFVWNTPDPYSGPNSDQYLGQFQANTGAFNGDLGHLVALESNGGIAAGFSGICNPNTDESLCYSGIDNSFSNVPTYSWTVFVITHEMGHLLGSRHTHACVWNGNNTAIDGCAGWVEGGCALPGSPAGGGTIMSYCHFTTGIDFNQGFGPQPGNVIRNTIANASCLSASCTAPANDLCSGATPLSCGGSATGSISQATSTGAVGGCGSGGNGTDPGVWFTFTGNGQIVTISTAGSDFDTQINLYQGSCGALTCLDGDDDSGPGATSQLTYCTQAGATYYIYLDGFGGDVGNYSISLACAPDAQPPSISCPGTQTVNNTPGQCGAIVNYPAASATDNCTVASITYSKNSGTFFSVGSTTVTATATDATGNSASCSFTVTVNDNEAPTAACLNTTVYLQPDGMYTIQAADVLDFANSSDNCSFTVTGISPAVVDCDDFNTTVPVTVTITDPSSNSDNCTANVYVDKSYALPLPWDSDDIGNPGPGNSYAYDPCVPPLGEFTITAGANNNGLGSDNMASIEQDLCGDFEIIVKIESVTPNGMGGLMARESEAAGSKMVGMYTNLSNIIRWEARTATNGNKAVSMFNRPLPYWLKLVRQGNWFYGYYSFNGASFSIVTAQLVSMNSCLDVGMTAFSNIPGQQAVAVFSNVAVSGGVVIPLVVLPGNTAEPGAVGRSISLFPNPAQDVVTVEMGVAQGHGLPIPGLQSGAAGETTLRLRNELGQLLETRRIDADTERFDWNISSLNPGLYFIEIHEEGQAPQMLRFVKAK